MYGLRWMYGLHILSSHRLAEQLNPLKFCIEESCGHSSTFGFI